MGLNFKSTLILLQFGAWVYGDFIRLDRGLAGGRPWNHHWYHHTQYPEQWPQGSDSDFVKFDYPHPSFYHHQLHPQMSLTGMYQPPPPPRTLRYNPLPVSQRFQAPYRLPHFHPPPQVQRPPNPPQQPPERTRYNEPRASQAKISSMAQLPSSQASQGPCGIVVVNKIVEGKNAPRGFLPWQVALVYMIGGQQLVRCSGALIHPRFVLTAQHCVDPREIKGAKLLGVLLGTSDLRVRDKLSRFYTVDKVIRHSEYRSFGRNGMRNPADICILRLPEPAPYTEFIRPVCLPTTKVPGDLGSQAQVFRAAGWGAMNTTENKEYSDVLLWVSLPSMSAAECSKQLSVFVDLEQQVCAGGQKEDTCSGDSGTGLIRMAPAMTNRSDRVYEVVGLLSYGKELCGQKKPAVYTRVDAFLPWIQNIINSG